MSSYGIRADHHFHFSAVLPSDVEPERVGELLSARGAAMIGTIPRAETQLAEQVWEYANSDRIRLIEDHFVRINALRAESLTFGKPASLIRELHSEFDLQDVDSLVALSRSTNPNDRSHAMRGLAAVVERFRKDVTDAIARGLNETDRSLRDDALHDTRRTSSGIFGK